MLVIDDAVKRKYRPGKRMHGAVDKGERSPGKNTSSDLFLTASNEIHVISVMISDGGNLSPKLCK